MTYVVIALALVVLGVALGYWLAKHGVNFSFGTHADASKNAAKTENTPEEGLAEPTYREPEPEPAESAQGASGADSSTISAKEVLSATSRAYREAEESRPARIQREIDNSLTRSARADAERILERDLPQKLEEYVNKNDPYESITLYLKRDDFIDRKWGLIGKPEALKGSYRIVYETLVSLGAKPEINLGAFSHNYYIKVGNPQALR